MIVACVYVHVKEEHINDFMEATTKNHLASVQEQGNMRFDVLQQDGHPSRFLLYEAYKSPEDAAAHKETEHYKAWRDSVADWMAEPRSAGKYTAICPAD